MLLQRATVRNVSRALREIKVFEWEGDYKPMARQTLKEIMEKSLEIWVYPSSTLESRGMGSISATGRKSGRKRPGWPWRDAITRPAQSSPRAAATWMKRENRIDNNPKPTTQTVNHPGPCQQVDCRYLSLSERRL